MYGVKASFGLCLVMSIVAVTTSLLLLSSSSSSRSSESDERRSSTNMQQSLSLQLNLIDLWRVMDLINGDPYGRSTTGKKSFFEVCFSYLFGDEDPNRG